MVLLLLQIAEFAKKRAEYGESKYQAVRQRITDLDEAEVTNLSYHTSCYKDVVHTGKLKREEKRFQESSVKGCAAPAKKGRPSSYKTTTAFTTETNRSGRSKDQASLKLVCSVVKSLTRVSFTELKVKAWVKDLCF